MKFLERAYIFQCPHCDGSGQGTTYNYIEPNPYFGLEPSLSPFPQMRMEEGYLACSLCKGARVIFLTIEQIRPENLAMMNLMLEETPVQHQGPEIRSVTIRPRNKSER